MAGRCRATPTATKYVIDHRLGVASNHSVNWIFIQLGTLVTGIMASKENHPHMHLFQFIPAILG